MNISKRLRVISDFISDNSFILDVGCDHALLDIYVTKNKNNVRAIASDINEGPLKSALENVKKYNAKDVTVVLGDGLSSYKEGVDTVVISGLGSTTIVSILKKDNGVLSNIKKLIISSNNDYYFLRKSVCEMGFYISDEVMVLDRGKYYPIIIFEKGFRKYNEYEYRYGPILLNKMDSIFIDYLKNERDKFVNIYKSLGFKYIFKKFYVKKQISFINKRLSR